MNEAGLQMIRKIRERKRRRRKGCRKTPGV